MVFVSMSVSLCASCTPISLDRSTVEIELIQSRLLCDLYNRPSFLHRAHCLSLKLTCLDFLGIREPIDSILRLPSAPFWFFHTRGLTLYFCIILDLIKNQLVALVLTGVISSVKLYWVCHLAGHIRSKCGVRLALSKGNTCLVA
jgi:hypothetical protein